LLPLRGDDPQHPVAHQVAEQDAHHPEGKVNLRGQVDDWRGATADAEDPPVLRPRPEVLGRPLAGGDDDIDEPERRALG
jgi:hypothetical protein